MGFLTGLFFDYIQSSDCAESEAHRWHDKTLSSSRFYLWEFSLELLIKSILCCYVMYIVICKLKLKQLFLVAIPITLLGSFILQIAENFKSILGDYEIYDLPMFRLTLVHSYLYIVAHWIFIA